MKYRAAIPAPSAKRMLANKVLIIHCEDGWGQGQEQRRKLTDETEVEFDVPDDIEWSGQCITMDAMVFGAWVEYQNSTGSRKELLQLTPVKQ